MTNMEKSVPVRSSRKLPEIRLVSIGSRKQKFWQALKSVLRNYVDNTTVHGFFHLRGSKGFKRFRLLVIKILI